MQEKQLEFNFPAHSQREDMIAALDFESHMRARPELQGKAKAETLASLLAHIGKYRECFESQDRICQRLKINERKLQRAIEVLRGLDILTTERKPLQRCQRQTYNHHRINWTRVGGLIELQRSQHQPDSTVGLINQKRADQPDSTVAINPTVEADQPDSTVAINPTVLSPSLLERELELEEKEVTINTPPPNPPPSQAQAQEEEGGNFVLIRTQKPRPAQALAARSTVSDLHQRSAQAARSTAETPRPAQALAARSPGEALAFRYRQANVYDADQLLDWLMPIVGGEYLERLLEYWRANQANWDGAGALRTRLKRSRPDLAIDDGWPPLRPKPVAPKIKTAAEYAAEREAFRIARERAKRTAAEEPALGELFRLAQAEAMA
jgi:hypothetical protein